ncbi:MAG TPA: cytochrome b N-terminal domain-containing protein [Thermoleophilaceae bacterium]|jgi:quinol-cytochrome oxidoreductase complex cytochrome b subunit
MKLLPGPLRRKNGKNGTNGNGNGNGATRVMPGDLRNGHEERTKEREKEADRKRQLDAVKETGINVVGFLDERTGGGPFMRFFLYRKVPPINWFYTLGSATMFAFVSQAVTGVFLAMYYRPSSNEAYESVQHITNDVFAGELVRGMHRWGATVMMILIFMHMGRVFFFGGYKYPRELNWVIGVVLLVLTLMMGLTGYLLPFDQRSFWATVVAVNLNSSGPIIGPYLADFLRGGAEFGATTISRFYALHMLLIPGLIMALIGAHLYLVVKLGTTAPPWLKAEKARDLAKEEI